MREAPAWFDAHLDLAYLALGGRDMRSADLSMCGGPDLPAGVTLPSLREGSVRWTLATIFTEADGTDAPIAYPSGDAEAAHRAGLAQLRVYEEWAKAGEIELPNPPSHTRGTGERAPGVPSYTPTAPHHGAARPLRAGILIEGADPIRSPDELAWWHARGVVAIGLAWARASRYAGGNATEMGLSDPGRVLVREMDRLGVVHDVSHLSDAALADLLRATDRPVIASHSNCRSILTSAPIASGPHGSAIGMIQRHLTDDTIREIVRRGGVVGLNLFSPFLVAGGGRDRRATIVEAVAHVERVCDLAGDRTHVGLGSDMDGGFSASKLPEGIDRPADLARLADALAARGWTEGEIGGFASGNWRRFFARHAPHAFGAEAT
jgi:membrane dipeptidase